jgi:prepilin-type N-terminal cleavage/methylation domain-containing protein
MRRSGTIRRPAAGFTLVELIVVIGIISLLVGLLLAAISKARDAGPRAQTKAEIGQLGVAIEQFKSTYDVKYIPHGLVLTTNPNFNQNIPAYAESQAFISKVWPKAAASFFTLPPATDQVTNQPIPHLLLDGNMVLVLLLGGIPPPPDPNNNELFTTAPPPGKFGYPFPPYFQGNHSGFYNTATTPLNHNNGYAAVNGDQAKGPFFDFKADRLKGGNYYDPYGTPYIYFSSKNGNDYNVFGKAFGDYVYPAPIGPNPVQIPTYKANGGWALPLTVSPFVGLDNKYINPNGFQIISAGKDKQFGRGGVFDPGTGDYSPGAQGGDDISNFYRGPLGGSN